MMNTMIELTDPAELEPIEGATALSWSRSWSEETAMGVDKQLKADILAALDSDARIPYVRRRGEFLYNFWRDADHPRGLWRCTSLTEFRQDNPSWKVLIDVDALAAIEEENWVWAGAQLSPHRDRALIKLSNGGTDATAIREFDLTTGEFVPNGFSLPAAKTQVSWVDTDTILVSTDFGVDSLTESGYPRCAKIWRRGQQLGQAEELFSAEHSDLMVSAWADTDYGRCDVFIRRVVDFYHSQTFYKTDAGMQKFDLPEDCEVIAKAGFIFIMPRTEFAGVPVGGLGVMPLAQFLTGQHTFIQLFTPDAQTSLQSVDFTATTVVITALKNVSTFIYQVPFHNWSARSIMPLPRDISAQVVATDTETDEIWISASGFTQPNTLYLFDQELTQIRQLPNFFDATGMETRQHFTLSADGTTIPYFITGRFTGTPQPTLVYAYGGFEISLVPSYSASRGIAWLQHGYFYVQANLRGGGEYGPDWHNQATQSNRHKVFEDHQAVLKDVVARGYSTVNQLAIRGGSNGGLLSAVALTQYPQLFSAAIAQVPLCDMLRYHLWSAGASWIAEYGDPELPEQREYLESYSPLANIDTVEHRVYPPALVTTSTRDDRVHPAHARLFAYALLTAGQPVDYYENTEGGHAGASNNTQTAFMEALIYSWLYQQLD